MIGFVIGLIGGMAWLQQQASLDGLRFGTMAGIGLGIFILGLALRRRWMAQALLLLAGITIGIAWAGWRAELRLSDELARAVEGKDVTITGRIVDLPQSTEHGLRFGFAVDSASEPGVPHRVMLNWYAPRKSVESDERQTLDVGDTSGHASRFHAGERWQLVVRLKRPHGTVNPHGFDVEGWLLEQNWRATGYIRPQGALRLITTSRDLVSITNSVREVIRERFEAALVAVPVGPDSYAGVLVALAIGDQSGIRSEQWQFFARTGITHLVSISGLHITMLAALAHWLCVGLWRGAVRRSDRMARLLLRFPAHQCGAAAGALAALVYAALSGFAIPAQRTLLMLLVVLVAVMARRHASPSRVLALALLMVLAIDPWAVNAAGFWLSFGAVAILMWAMRPLADLSTTDQPSSRWATWNAGLLGWLNAQWAVTLAGIPALLALFQQFSLISPLANAIAIPVVSFVVTPLALLATLPGLEVALLPAHHIMRWLITGLAYLARADYAVWQQAAPPNWQVVLALASCLPVLMGRLGPYRVLFLVGFVPLLSYVPQRPAAGDVFLSVLDVGQGQSVHVQTAQHDLLFDTGPGYSADADAGRRIVVPYLRALGVSRLDRLVISHSDRDHAGGTRSVVAGLSVAAVDHSLADQDDLLPLLYAQASPSGQSAATAVAQCVDAQGWDWDGVQFEFIHPLADGGARGGNGMSCVLQISAGKTRALIPGDIEARQESALVGRRGESLRSEILVVPHHGSGTSSTAAFIAQVAPSVAIIPVGYRSRFGHPKADVVARYAVAGTAIYRTDLDGAVIVRFGPGGTAVTTWRGGAPRYWHGR